jgi:conjugative transfer ATPase
MMTAIFIGIALSGALLFAFATYCSQRSTAPVAANAHRKRIPPTVSRLQQAYDSGPSFTDMLPWLEYLPDSQQILLIDGHSRVACYELDPFPTEGRTREYMDQAVESIASMIAESFNEYKQDPWVLQFYVNNEKALDTHLEQVRDYVSKNAQGSEFTEAFLNLYAEHLRDVTTGDGYFEDDMVTGSMWGGCASRIRMVIYRKYNESTPVEDPELELQDMTETLEANMDTMGIRFRRMTGEDFYYWMLFWFNPRPAVTQGRLDELRAACPYPGDEDLPIGSDLSELLCLNRPYFDEDKGYVYFDDMPHAVLQVISARTKPKPGHLTGERDKGSTLLDKLPEGTVLSYTLTMVAQDDVSNHVTAIRDRAVGDTADSKIKRDTAEQVLEHQASGNKIYALELAIYARAEDDRTLKRRLDRIQTQLTMSGLMSVPVSKEVIPIDNYMKNLPAVYSPYYDRKSRRKSKPFFVSHAAALAPVYGRSRGTGHASMFFFNRTGEPAVFDPLNYQDRTKSAHMLVFGPTGAGKSSMLLWVLTTMLAMHRPRLFIIEAGNSFGLFGQWLQRLNVSVNQKRLSMDEDISIPPFINAMKLLDLKDREKVITEFEDELIDQEEEGDAARDYLGEMELTSQIMVSGAGAERLSRAQRLAIRSALVRAAEVVYREYGSDGIVIPADVADQMETMSSEEAYHHHSREILEMAYAMRLFCDGLNGHLFNRREGQLWEEVDCTIVDLAKATEDGNEETLAVAYVSLLQNVNALLEREQMSDRHTIVLTDEGHLIFNNDLLPPFVIKATKMWRKLGGWYWLATQNVDDMPGTAERMLNMMEWWLCLAMPKDEVDKISRFKELNDEQRQMMLNCVKNPNKYVEGVVISERLQMLFRNVPPSLPLALAQTEKHEKAARMDMCTELGLTGKEAELDAAIEISERIRRQRLGGEK